MRKFIVFPDSHLGTASKDELSPITEIEFEYCDHWENSIETAFVQFLHHNHFHELYEYNNEALRIGKIVLETGEPEIDWSINYGDHERDNCKQCQRNYK